MKTKNYTKIAIRYARDVVSGDIVASRFTRLGCERFLNDLRRKDWEWKYSPKHANRVCGFIELLNCPENAGEITTKDKIKLMDWQVYVICNLYAFVNAKGIRRFKDGLLFIPRRSGKTTIGAALCLYHLIADYDPTATVFSTAVDAKQAKLIHRHMLLIADNTPGFFKKFNVQDLKNTFQLPVFKVLKHCEYNPIIEGKNVQSKDGRAVGFALADELHAMRKKSIINSLRDGMGSKPNSLMLKITTAGDITYEVGYNEYLNACNILEGKEKDDRYFASIYTLDPEDDPFLEANWRKANPAFDITFGADDFRHRAKTAQTSIDREDMFSFITKRLNCWLEGVATWIDGEKYDSCFEKFSWEDFKDCPCIVGLDLSRKNDITSACFTFLKEGKYYSLWLHWISGEEYENNTTNKEKYEEFVSSGSITVHEGNKIDLDIVSDELEKLFEKYNVVWVAYDAQFAPGTVDRLEKKFKEIVFNPVKQSTNTYDPAMTHFESLYGDKEWHHNGDPVAEWCFKNIAVRLNLQGIRSRKFPNRVEKDDNRKIDAGVACLMSIFALSEPEFVNPKPKKRAITF